MNLQRFSLIKHGSVQRASFKKYLDKGRLIASGLLIGLLFSTSAWALKDDQNQPIMIDSDSQHIDMKSSTVTFEGNVILTQGSIHMTADKLVVIRNEETSALQEVQGYGAPAKFSQKTDEGKTLKGQGNTLVYNIDTDKLVMTTNAELHQDNSVVTGEVITYKISTQNLQAISGKGSRVTTVLQPSELEKK